MFKYLTDMGDCFLKVVVVSKKSKKKKKKKKKILFFLLKKKKFFFFYFSQLGKNHMVLGKKWLFSIGNGAEIQPLEKGRKCPVLPEGTSALLFVVAELELQQLSSLSICDESSPVSTSSSFLFPIFLTSLQHFTSFWSSIVYNLDI